VHVKDLYSIIVTDKSAECRDFYVQWFGFQVLLEASWFVYLAATGDHAFGIAFMSPDHPSRPPGPEKFNGKGMFITIQVEDAAAEFERLAQGGLSIAYPLHDEPWVSGDSLCTIHQAPGLTSSSRSTQRLGSGKSTSLEDVAAQQAHTADGPSRRG
jgi:uncharacterized glyoxalase superfamily protein PhnB